MKNEKYRLVLQPMTHAEILRKYLADNGFSIIDEDIVKDAGNNKIYQLICAEFSGNTENYTTDELHLGRYNISRGGEVLREHCERLKKINTEIKMAKSAAGQSTSVEEEIIAVAEKYLH